MTTACIDCYRQAGLYDELKSVEIATKQGEVPVNWFIRFLFVCCCLFVFLKHTFLYKKYMKSKQNTHVSFMSHSFEPDPD